MLYEDLKFFACKHHVLERVETASAEVEARNRGQLGKDLQHSLAQLVVVVDEHLSILHEGLDLFPDLTYVSSISKDPVHISRALVLFSETFSIDKESFHVVLGLAGIAVSVLQAIA